MPLTKIAKLEAELRKFQKLDSEASMYVEVPICTRTHFNGEPPYVGWKGLGLALNETLDKLDKLQSQVNRIREAMRLEREPLDAIEEILNE